MRMADTDRNAKWTRRCTHLVGLCVAKLAAHAENKAAHNWLNIELSTMVGFEKRTSAREWFRQCGHPLAAEILEEELRVTGISEEPSCIP